MTSSLQARNRLPTPARDRRGVLAVLALFLVLIGALGAALIVYRTGNRVDVLVASHTIPAGQKVSAADFSTARVAADSGSVVASSAEGNFVGSFATSSIPVGTLINSKMFRLHGVIPDDGVVVGVTLSASQRPAKSIAAGDIVRLYYTPKTATSTTGSSSSGSSVAEGVVIVSAARVVDVSAAAAASSGDSVSISVLLTGDDAGALIGYSVQQLVGVGELPSSTHLSIDFISG